MHESDAYESNLPSADWPRYSHRPFPCYRFVPGNTPHPRRDPRGHSYGVAAVTPPAFSPDAWLDSEVYRYGIDLYNFAYRWECHDTFESLWHMTGTKTQQGNFFQALIQIAAANFKRALGASASTEKLARYGLTRFSHVPSHYMGLDVEALTQDVQSYFLGSRPQPARIRLALPTDPVLGMPPSQPRQ